MKRIFLNLLLAVLLFAPNAKADPLPDDGETGLALPRMVSLRSNLVNARSGPGARYPISWVYRQKYAPVEIVAEFELWRKIKDWKGSESWVHKQMLTGKRTVKVVTPGENNIYDEPDYNSKVIAKAEEEVVGVIKKCPSGSSFCLINFENSIEGWIPKNNLFGVYPDEVID
jgi:SH3-like domain-containing protein